METVREVFKEIGRARVCVHLQVTPKAVSKYAVEGVMPSSWYVGMQELAEEKGFEIPKTLFSWRETAQPQAGEAAR